jgi:hypothetical protein
VLQGTLRLQRLRRLLRPCTARGYITYVI